MQDECMDCQPEMYTQSCALQYWDSQMHFLVHLSSRCVRLLAMAVPYQVIIGTCTTDYATAVLHALRQRFFVTKGCQCTCTQCIVAYRPGCRVFSAQVQSLVGTFNKIMVYDSCLLLMQNLSTSYQAEWPLWLRRTGMARCPLPQGATLHWQACHACQQKQRVGLRIHH